MMTDPIGDMLTRIRNGAHARKTTVDVPWSRVKDGIAGLLVAEGFLVSSTLVDEAPRKLLRLELRYDDRRGSVITGIRRVSRPSLRRYVGVDEIPQIRKGLGVSVLSTSKGLMVDREARKQKVGGEVVCSIW
jgi:small subunit ribosomal protein S8